MKIGIDIDDTITNTRSLQLVYWKEYVKNNPSKLYTNELPTNINAFGDNYINIFWDTYREKLFEATVKKNVCSVTERLKRDGHVLCIVTSKQKDKQKNLVARISDLMKNNGVIIDYIYTDVLDKAKFCSDNNIDLLIDDSINHIEAMKKIGLDAVLFNNCENYDGLQTEDWEELYNIICRINKI